MRAGGLGAVMMGVTLAIGLGACGDDDDDGASAPAAPKTSTEAENTPPPASKGGLTPPGAKLKVGQTATVGWTPPSLSLKNTGKAIKLQVTVEALEKGTQKDLKGINLDADQRGSTPYFLKVKIVNLGATGPSQDEPDLTFDAIDDRHQEQGSVTFIGDFPRCEDNRAPKPFSRGKSYQSCLTYLVRGGSIAEIRWKDGPAKPNAVSEYFDKPIVWRP